MHIAIAIDSFKGSLSSLEAASAVAEGVRAASPDAQITVCPLADGGEGTLDALLSATNGIRETLTVQGPLGSPVSASYGILPQTNTAVIEMAEAAGLTLLDKHARDPMKTTTFGVGELIRHAIEAHACRRFVVGLGGSATNDGGVGMLQALGYAFLDADGRPIPTGAKGLASLARIDLSGAHPALAECVFTLACDVNNPLCGARGCSAIFAPQKGATAEQILIMDACLADYARQTHAILGVDHANQAGAGAAGGLGFAFLSYLRAEMRAGIDVVIEATDLESVIQGADLVITGEGRLDGQTGMGKAPVGVARVAKRHKTPVLALAGSVTADAVDCNRAGIDAYFPILPAPCSLDEAMSPVQAKTNLKRTAEQAMRLIGCFLPVIKEHQDEKGESE